MEAERHERRWQTRLRGRPRLIFRPLSRTGENPPYGILGEAMETSASFEARSAQLSYPTANERTYGSVRGVLGNRYPYRDKIFERSRNVYENKENGWQNVCFVCTIIVQIAGFWR